LAKFYGKNTWNESAYTSDFFDYLAVDGNIMVPHRVIPQTNYTQKYISDYQTNVDPNARYIKISDYIKYKNHPVSAFKYNSDATFNTMNSPTQYGHSGSVIEKELITIAAPTEAQIREIIKLPTTTLLNKFDDVAVYKTNDLSNIDGLILKANANTFEVYARNDDAQNGVLKCVGDIIIDGSLFLKNAIIATDSSGCRIYTTGSIFIQGPITYQSSSATPNLQLSSTRVIMMGFRSVVNREARSYGLHNFQQAADESFFNSMVTSDRDRIDADFIEDAGPYRLAYSGSWTWNETYYKDLSPNFEDQNWSWNFYPTSSGTDNSQSFIGFKLSDDDDSSWVYNPSRSASSSNPIPPRPYSYAGGYVGGSGGPEYHATSYSNTSSPKISSIDNGREYWAEDTTFQQPTAKWAAALTRKRVDYNHLVLNAPKVWSRYYGNFKGMIIAEILVPPGQNPWTRNDTQRAVFEYDHSLDKVPLFPLFDGKLFSVTD
jgi:hypothetical protein